MIRLTAPNGAVVRVSDEQAAPLVAQGYKPVPAAPAAGVTPAKEPRKASARKSD